MLQSQPVLLTMDKNGIAAKIEAITMIGVLYQFDQ